MTFSDLSEYCVRPKRLLVHDPTIFNAFRRFSSMSSPEELGQRFGFRDFPDVQRLHDQHTQLVTMLNKHVRVTYVSEVLTDSDLRACKEHFTNNPNHLFTRDAMVTIPWVPDGYLLCNMKLPCRRSEPEVLARVAHNLGLREIIKVPPHMFVEGGDIFPLNYDNKRVLLMGYGPRTSLTALLFLRDNLVRDGLIDEIIGIELAPWRINLDGCFFPVSRKLIVCNPESVYDGVRLEKHRSVRISPLDYFAEQGFTMVKATKEESYHMQACNFACLDRDRLVAYGITDRVNNILREHGLEVATFPGDQLVQGNGGPHCMTRPIYKEP